MDMNDLGPLETAALRALAQAELIGAPLTVASLWRSLPGYRTALRNVRAALEPGQPLSSFVTSDKDHYVLRGREDLLRGMATRQGWADSRWRDLKGALRGLGKVPWVEALGVTGPMAWGLLPSTDAPCELVVIAEGGRVALARAAVRAWRRAAGKKVEIRVAAVLDADSLVLAEGTSTEAWWLLAVRPVVNELAFARLREVNDWARARFPNFDADDAGGLPEYFLGDRVDGKLAAVRRAAVATDDDGVLLRSAGRRELAWETALLGIVAGRPIARACNEWVGEDGVDVLRGTDLHDGDGRVEARMVEIAASTAEAAAHGSATATATAKAKATASAESPAVLEEIAESASAPESEPTPKKVSGRASNGSSRKRGPRRQRVSKVRTPRARGSASPEG